MKKIAAGLGAIVILFGIALATMPASVAWKVAKPYAPPAAQNIANMQGNLWNGSAEIGSADAPVTLHWDIARAPLLAGKIAATLRVESGDSQLSGRILHAGGITFIHEWSGALSAAFLTRALSSYGVSISQPVTLENIQISATDQAFTSAEGKLRFAGGSVTYRDNGTTKSASLPPLNGILTTESDALILSISGPDRPLAQATLSRDGLLKLRLKREWFDLLGINWPGAADAGDYVFELQQDIF